MVNATAHTLIETSGALESRNGTLQFCAVKDNADGLVAQQVSREVPLHG